MKSYVHPTALVEDGVEIGINTAIWDNVHIRAPSSIGSECIIGEKTYIAYGVDIGDRVKVNAHVYICTGVTIEMGVMVSAGTIFTNDRTPRAATPDLLQLLPSEPDDSTERTLVRHGSTIGAGAIIGPGLTIGPFAMIGMGSVVTRSIGEQVLVAGNPARPLGFVCRCGRRLADEASPTCSQCGRSYVVEDERISGTD